MMMGVDLFAGAGGMSTGAMQAGITVQFAVESERYAAMAYRHNHPQCEVFSDDIRRLLPEKMREIPRGKDGTVVFGGPPCQGFSYSNSRTRHILNRDNWLFEYFVRVVDVCRPDFFVFENVQGIVNTARGLFLEAILERFSRLGYTLTYGVLNALDYGVPQSRSRFFLVGSNTGRQVLLPPKSTTRLYTVKDAIHDLPSLSNGACESWLPYPPGRPSPYAQRLRGPLAKSSGHLVTRNSDQVVRRYPFVPQGGNWQDIPPELMGNYEDRHRCHTGIYHRLPYTQPSSVIANYRKNMVIHPCEDRGLSVREAARLQSFPDSSLFAGSIGFQQQQVGNAVPPLLAEAVFAQLCSAA